jgi:hypothetical protein
VYSCHDRESTINQQAPGVRLAAGRASFRAPSVETRSGAVDEDFDEMATSTAI